MDVRTYRAKAPAKLNLRLKVTGRRPDGYHELVSLMVPVDLCDVLQFTLTPEKIELRWEGLPVPDDEGNLVRRAAEAFFRKSGVKGGVGARVVKNIPVSAGMGGGSSDAAATLLSLNHLYSRPLSFEALKGLALQLGADVPFFGAETLHRHRNRGNPGAPGPMAAALVPDRRARFPGLHGMGV